MIRLFNSTYIYITFPQEYMEISLSTYLWYPSFPLKLSVIEDGLTADTGITLKFFCGIDTLVYISIAYMNFHYIDESNLRSKFWKVNFICYCMLKNIEPSFGGFMMHLSIFLWGEYKYYFFIVPYRNVYSDTNLNWALLEIVRNRNI